MELTVRLQRHTEKSWFRLQRDLGLAQPKVKIKTSARPKTAIKISARVRPETKCKIVAWPMFLSDFGLDRLCLGDFKTRSFSYLHIKNVFFFC